MRASLQADSKKTTASRAVEAHSGRPLKIGIVIDVDYPHVGEVRPRKLARSFRQSGHEVVFVSWNSRQRPATEILPDGIVHRFGYLLRSRCFRLASATFPANPFWVAWIMSVAHRQGLDCLIVSNLRLALPAIMAGKLLRLPVVVDLQENTPEVVKLYAKTRWVHYISKNSWLVKALDRLCASLADHVWVVTPERIEYLPRRVRSQARVSVVSNTPGLEEVAPPKEPRTGSGFDLVYVGLFAPGVGSVELILDALADVVARDKRVRLLIGGGTQLEAQVKEMGLADNVVFAGMIPPDQLTAWLQRGDLGVIAYNVNPSTNTTISNKLFHYMAAGLAVLSTDMAPTRRIIEEAGCGAIIPQNTTPQQLAELILAMKDSPLELAAMGQRGRQAVLDKYNWETDFSQAQKTICALVAKWKGV